MVHQKRIRIKDKKLAKLLQDKNVNITIVTEIKIKSDDIENIGKYITVLVYTNVLRCANVDIMAEYSVLLLSIRNRYPQLSINLINTG